MSAKMTSVESIPLKMAEISIRKFNEDAIPGHLGLLRNHKSQIEKSLALQDWERVKREEINATRVIKQLKNLLLEMEILRNKIHTEEVPKFDDLTNRSRREAIESIQEFVELKLKSPDKSRSSSNLEDFDPDVLEPDLPQLESEFKLPEHQLKAREACLIEYENLHREVQDIHELFHKFSENVQEQAESVTLVESSVSETAENVVHGEQNLRTALKYKKAMYPVCGALLGTCIGGPIGFFAGLKAGGLAAVGCGILGFTGGEILKRKEQEGVEVAPEATESDKTK
ncbi:syntaxin-17 [Phlebotomus argentipes]|uniref:syntaxin-17 n=1 Tax=Phlebotomus argentipes TaxID=94469 RepID=UPI002892A5CC|nr:syntaxin-17 [Phlebotomus argentipes]